MTLKQLNDNAGREIDALFAPQQDEQLLLIIESGTDEEFALEFLELRAEQYAAWRPSVLVDIRRALATGTPMESR